MFNPPEDDSHLDTPHHPDCSGDCDGGDECPVPSPAQAREPLPYIGRETTETLYPLAPSAWAVTWHGGDRFFLTVDSGNATTMVHSTAADIAKLRDLLTAALAAKGTT